MATSLAIVGQAKLGTATLGWPADLADPPAKVRANGACWGLVQDPSILQALTDAADAAAAADTAAIAADEARTMAGTATRNYTSTSPASGVPRSDKDRWQQIDGTQNVIAEWYWNGTPPAGAWVKTMISSAAISNLDVGKLSSSSATINAAVINKLAVQIATVIELHADRITAGKLTSGQIDTPNLAAALATILELNADRITAGTIGAARLDVNDLSARIATIIELNADRITVGTIGADRLNVNETAARVATVIKLNADTIVAGVIGAERLDVIDIAAKTAVFQKVDIKNLFATTGTMSEAVITKLFAEVVKAKMVTSEAFIGENAILTGAVTARTITASEEMSAKLGEFLRVRTEMLEANAVDGMVITGAIIQSPGSGAGYQLTEGGYTSRDANGNVTVRLPSDGTPAQFKGDIEAQSLTASGRMSLQATESEIASGAALVLESGVQAPSTSPTVGISYKTVAFPAPPERATVTGLAYAAGLWWRGVNVLGGGEGDRLEGVDSTGTIKISFAIPMDPRNGIAAIGDEIFILGKRHDKPESEQYVRVYKVTSTTATYQREWAYPNYGTGTYQPGIGTDGTNILIAQCWAADGRLSWRLFNKTTGANISTVDTGYRLRSDVAGAYQGTANFGATRVAVAKTNGITEVFSTAGILQNYVGWFSAYGVPVFGLTWALGKFWHLTADGIVEYSDITAPSGVGVGDTNDWWIAQTLVGASGAETLTGPARRFTFVRRSELQIAGAQIPPGVTGSRFYLARKPTTPVRSDFHLLATAMAGETVRITTLPSAWANGAVPPAVNTFPASTPASIKSRIGGFEVLGNGSGKWGPLTFAANGTMSGIPVVKSGIVAITPTAANTPTAHTVTFPGAAFTANPHVVATAATTAPGTIIQGVGVLYESPTSVTIYLTRTNTTPTYVMWVAVGQGGQ